MLKNTFIFFCVVVSFMTLQGCNDIDDNRRVLVTGNLVNDAGNPIEGIAVEARGNSTVLGKATSDEYGAFNFTSIESNAKDYSIYINAEPDQDSTYATARYVNNDAPANSTEDNTIKRDQNLYDLGTVVLRQVQRFKFEIIKNPATKDTLNYTFTITEANCTVSLSDIEMNDAHLDCFTDYTISGEILPEDNSYSTDFKTLLNTEATFSYRINQGITHEISIPIRELTLGYGFYY